MYINDSYIRDQITEQFLDNLLSLTPGGVTDEAVIQDIINDTESLMDGYIMVSGYDRDSVYASPPSLLQRIGLQIFKYYAVSRQTFEMERLQQLVIDYQTAVEQLQKITEGSINLPGFERVRKYEDISEKDTASFNNDIFKTRW